MPSWEAAEGLLALQRDDDHYITKKWRKEMRTRGVVRAAAKQLPG
jgi:hypothetical protein